MTEKSNAGCCTGGEVCCETKEQSELDKNKITIDFLYLDLSVCIRCQGAETDVHVNKINVNSKELAITHKFLSSPTIRVNGHDFSCRLKKVYANPVVLCAERYSVE